MSTAFDTNTEIIWSATRGNGLHTQKFGRALRPVKPVMVSDLIKSGNLAEYKLPAKHDYTPSLSVFEALTINRRKRGSFGCYALLSFVAGFAVATAWYL